MRDETRIEWTGSEAPDALNTCPRCEQRGTFQEFAKRWTHQPVTLGQHTGSRGERSDVEPVDYSDFDYSDDVEVTGYGCRECGAEWPNLDALLAELRLAAIRVMAEAWREAVLGELLPDTDDLAHGHVGAFDAVLAILAPERGAA